MVEGQEGVTWDEWLALARACEEAGLDALFRSDHYLSGFGDPRSDVLDAWATLAALAAGGGAPRSRSGGRGRRSSWAVPQAHAPRGSPPASPTSTTRSRRRSTRCASAARASSRPATGPAASRCPSP